MLGLDGAVVRGLLVERIIFGVFLGICVEDVDSSAPATDTLFDVEGVLDPLFLTFVRTINRQIFGLPRTRRWWVYEPTSEPTVTRSNP